MLPPTGAPRIWPNCFAALKKEDLRDQAPARTMPDPSFGGASTICRSSVYEHFQVKHNEIAL